jgi:cytoskeletal protein CcmA (bactofilin family)
VNVRGTVEGNIFVTERCELQANCTVRGDIEAPRLVVNENATFLGSAKVGTGKHSRPDVRLLSRTPVSNVIHYAKFRSRSHDAVIRVLRCIGQRD